jgi:hypothetical protein
MKQDATQCPNLPGPPSDIQGGQHRAQSGIRLTPSSNGLKHFILWKYTMNTNTNQPWLNQRTDGRTHSHNLSNSPSPSPSSSPLVTLVSSSRPQRYFKLQVSSLRLLPPRDLCADDGRGYLVRNSSLCQRHTHEIFRLKNTLYKVQSWTLQKNLVTAGAAPLIFCILYFMTFRCLN